MRWLISHAVRLLVAISICSMIGQAVSHTSSATVIFSHTKAVLQSLFAHDLPTCLAISHQLARNCSKFSEDGFRTRLSEPVGILAGSLQTLNSSLCPKHDQPGVLSCEKLSRATNLSADWQSTYMFQIVEDMKAAICSANFELTSTQETFAMERLAEMISAADITSIAPLAVSNETTFFALVASEGVYNESVAVFESQKFLVKTVIDFRTLLLHPPELGFLLTTVPASTADTAYMASALRAQRFVVCAGAFPAKASLTACSSVCEQMSAIGRVADSASALSGKPHAKTEYQNVAAILNRTCAPSGVTHCLERSCLTTGFVCGAAPTRPRVAKTEMAELTALLDGNDFESCVKLMEGFAVNCDGFFRTKVISDVFQPLEELFTAIVQLHETICGTPSLDRDGVYNCTLLSEQATTIGAITQQAIAEGSSTNSSAAFLAHEICSETVPGDTDSEAEQRFLATLQLSVGIIQTTFTQAINLEQFYVHPTLYFLLSRGDGNAVVLAKAINAVDKYLPIFSKKAGDYFKLLETYIKPLDLYFEDLPKRLRRIENQGEDFGLKPPNETYTDRNDGYLTCAMLYPQSLRMCPWMCYNLTSLLDMTDLFAPDRRENIALDKRYDLLYEMSRTCVPATDKTWTHCIDPSCESSNKVCENNPKSAETAKARHDADGLCFRPVCPFPLKPTAVEAHWVDEIQEVLSESLNSSDIVFPLLNYTFNGSVLPCGRDCVSVGFTTDDNDKAKVILGVFGWTLFVMSILAVLSFYLNRERLNRFPTQILLFMNLTAFVGNLAHLLQFFVDVKKFTCYDDGTLRIKEPDSSAACTLSFIFTVYNLQASLFWWMCLTHAWYITFKTMKTRGAKPEENAKYMYAYHVIAWGLPLIFLSVFLGKREIDGFPLYGICFPQNADGWFWFGSLPIGVVGMIGLPFLILGFRITRQHQKSDIYRSQSNASTSKAAYSRSVSTEGLEHLKGFMTQVLTILILSFFFLIFQFATGLSTKLDYKQWEKDTEESIICRVTNCQPEVCKKVPSLSFTVFMLQPISIMLEGILLCSWIFSGTVWQQWKHSSRKGKQMIRSASRAILVQRSSSTPSGNSSGMSSQISASTVNGKHGKLGGKQQYADPADLVLAYTEQTDSDGKSSSQGSKSCSGTPAKSVDSADKETNM